MSQNRARSVSSSKNAKRYLLTASALALATGFSVATGPVAFAADSQSAAPTPEIVITGSRIKRATDFESPNPTTVVDSSYLQNLGIVNLGDAMTQLPQNVSSFTPQSTGNSNFFAGSTIANLRGINPFFGSRTLTLVDGRRHVPTNQGDSVDLNVIPTVLLQRMDVVTGGASAAYGSGAVSGVNNIVLNKTLEGAKIDADYGVSTHGDGDSLHIGAAAGTSLLGGRGHLVIGGEYQKQDAIGCETARQWCQDNVGFLANNGADPSLPSQVLESNRRYNGISVNGVFWNNAVTANADGVTADGTGIVPFALGTDVAGNISTSNAGGAVGGDGLLNSHYTNLIGETERKTFHGHFDYDVTDSINFGLDGEYAKINTDNPTTQATTTTNHSIFADNAYLFGHPELIAAQANSQAINSPLNPFAPPSARFNKDWSAQLDSHSTFDTTVWSIVGDLNGGIGDTSWTWDAYVSHGHTDRFQNTWANPRQVAMNLALDAVFPYNTPGDPTSGLNTSADPICRVTRGDPSAAPGAFGLYGAYDPALAMGCVPLNPFGTGAIPADANAYAFGYLQEEEIVNQTVAAANVTGDLFKGFGAGPVGVAVGGEYRWENIKNLNQSAGTGPFQTDYNIQYGESFAGKVNVWETYGEINVPVLKDVPLAQNVEFDGAVRYSHYHNVGQGPIFQTANHGLATWKVSGVWDVTSWLRIRGSQSRDSRAGNFRELYYGQNIPVSPGSLFSFFFCPGSPSGCTIYLRGNPNVKPEKSDTTTAGIVLQPGGALEGLQFAADYYHISLKNGVTPAGGQQSALLAQCRMVDADTCTTDLGTVDWVTPRDPDPANWQFLNLYEGSYNAASYKVSGIDISLSYNHQFANMDSINVRLLGSKTFKQVVVTALGGTPTEIKGQTGTGALFLPDFQSEPNWTGNLSVTYNHGPWSGTVQGRYISSGTFNYMGAEPGDPNYNDPAYTTYSTNHLGFYQIYSLNLSYTFRQIMGDNSDLQLFLSVNNLFDRDPPAIGSANYYDRLGRMFRFGARANF